MSTTTSMSESLPPILLTADGWWVWGLLVAAALFYAVRQLIWSSLYRDAIRHGDFGAEMRGRLKRRASLAAVVVSLGAGFGVSWWLFLR